MQTVFTVATYNKRHDVQIFCDWGCMEDPINLIGTLEMMAAERDGGIGNFL